MGGGSLTVETDLHNFGDVDSGAFDVQIANRISNSQSNPSDVEYPLAAAIILAHSSTLSIRTFRGGPWRPDSTQLVLIQLPSFHSQLEHTFKDRRSKQQGQPQSSPGETASGAKVRSR